MIDREKFDEQYQYFDPEIVIEIIDLFRDEKQDRFEALEKNLEELNYSEMERNSHALKGVLGNFMAPLPFRLAFLLEECARAKDHKSAGEALSDLRKACDELAEELNEIKKQLQR